MRRVNFYEALQFIFQCYEDMDGVREQDYEVSVGEVVYRGILFNSGFAVGARREHSEDVQVTFWILEPGHAVRK